MEGIKTHVVVTRIGDYWVTQTEARKVAESLKEAKYITLEGSMISVYAIDAIVTAKQYEESASQHGKSWRCKYGNVHTARDHCRCWIAINAPAPPRELDISDEQRAINKARAQAAKEYIRKHLGKDTAALKDTAAYNLFVDRRASEILASDTLNDSGSVAGTKTGENSSDEKSPHSGLRNGSK